MKKKILVLSVLVLIMSSIRVSKATEIKQSTTIKVMSFNIRFNNPDDKGDINWSMRREPCREMIEEIAPDVIGMQEPRYEMWDQIIDMLPAYGIYRIPITEEIPDAKSGRIMLLYLKDKYTVLDAGHFWLSETPDLPSQAWNSTDRQYRAAAWMQLKVNKTGEEFYFLTTHFPYKKDPVDTDVRKLCSQLIVDRMKGIAGEEATVFVTGDMNASYSPTDLRRVSLDPFYDWMQSAREEAKETDNKLSFNGFEAKSDSGDTSQKSTRNIDHIFYRNAQPIDFKTITSPKYGVKYISDHYPIISTFRIN